MSRFHERLKALRDESGKTQAVIAEDLEMTPQSFSYYLNGREPNYDTLIKIANYFNVTTDYLLGIDDNKNKESFKNLNLQLEDLGSLISGTKDTDGILNGLIWIMLAPQTLKKNGVPETSTQILVKCIRQLISCLAFSSTKSIEFFDNTNINPNSFASYCQLVNSSLKIAKSALTLYFSGLVEKVAKYSESPTKVQDSEVIKYIYMAFMGNIDLDRAGKDLRSASEELGIIPPASTENIQTNDEPDE